MSDIIISDDKSKFPVEKAIELLHTTYWAEYRDPEVIRKSIENSIVFGVYNEDSLIGMARVISDFATTFYIADVIIDEKYRGNGLGKKLISTIMSDERFSSLLRAFSVDGKRRRVIKNSPPCRVCCYRMGTSLVY